MMVGKKFLRFFLFWSYDFFTLGFLAAKFFSYFFVSDFFLEKFLRLIFVEKIFGVRRCAEFFREIFSGSDFLSGKNF